MICDLTSQTSGERPLLAGVYIGWHFGWSLTGGEACTVVYYFNDSRLRRRSWGSSRVPQPKERLRRRLL